jgi:hypothetical protein
MEGARSSERRRRRAAFAAAYVGVQVGLIATAGHRADAAFGFRMFSESSTIKVSLSREIDAPSGHGTVAVPVVDGAWAAHDKDGQLRRVRWSDRVKESALATFDVPMHASYSADAQVARWHAALDYVASHTPEDAESRALSLDISVRRNGRDPQQLHFVSVRK